MNTWGHLFRVTTWGESHGQAIGAVIDGCPAGLQLRRDDIQKELDRRRPGQSTVTSQRSEKDTAQILSGIYQDRTLGTPISIVVQNEDVDSRPYDDLRHVPRPGHADYTYHTKYGWRNHRGGGRASARETVARVAAGAVAKKLLERREIRVLGHVVEIHGIRSKFVFESPEDLLLAEQSIVRCCDLEASDKMVACIERAREAGNSVGGIAEIVAFNVPPGVGNPVFGKLDAELGAALMSIGAVKGVEMGVGFMAAQLKGSEMNDQLTATAGRIEFRTNRAGGVLGGISTGEPILCRIAVKPTPSIRLRQTSVDLETLEETDLSVKGRHDPCILPRIVPVAEAMVAIVLADLMLMGGFVHPARLWQ
ncbi:MAG TPA: chorismate synthase [Candidatus Bathyarchaeia archaeon]|nr:chorismate synthase [Candidatus Bathyarchaeia archaeon]